MEFPGALFAFFREITEGFVWFLRRDRYYTDIQTRIKKLALNRKTRERRALSSREIYIARRVYKFLFQFFAWSRNILRYTRNDLASRNASASERLIRARLARVHLRDKNYARRHENARARPKFTQGSCSVKNSPVCRRGECEGCLDRYFVVFAVF